MIVDDEEAVQPTKTLLVGDSIITDLNSERYTLDCDPVCQTTGTICDITARLVEMKGANDAKDFKTIILHCG